MTRIRENMEDTFAAVAFAERGDARNAEMLMRGLNATPAQNGTKRPAPKKTQTARTTLRAD